MIHDQKEAIRKKDYWIVGPGRKKERKERKKQRKVRRRSRSPPLWELKNRWCPGCSGVRSMGQWTGHGASHALSLSLFTLLSTPCLDRRSVSRFTVQSCPDSVQAIRLVQAVGGTLSAPARLGCHLTCFTGMITLCMRMGTIDRAALYVTGVCFKQAK